MRLRHQTLANDQRARAEVMGAKCDKCPLRDSGPCVFGDGPKDAKIVLVGEGPGRAEMEVGKPFVGKSGEILEELLAQLRVPRHALFITNATLHFPPGGDLDVFITKKKKELGDDFVHPVDACRERLFYELRIPRCHTCGGYYVGSPEVRCNCARPVWAKRETPPPEVIIPMGNFALSALLGFTGISNWRGSIINIETWRKTGTAFEEVKTLSSDEFLKIARSA